MAAIEAMVATGRAGDAVPLARRAVDRVTAALLYMDDSSGIVGGDLRELMELCARACRAASPDPVRLAAWLVALHVDGPQDAFFREGDEAEFAVYLDELRIRHKRKTAFITVLDKARLA